MPYLLPHSESVPIIRTCLHNAVAHCREQLLDEQHNFILQNDWELMYLVISIIAIYFSPKI